MMHGLAHQANKASQVRNRRFNTTHAAKLDHSSHPNERFLVSDPSSSDISHLNASFTSIDPSQRPESISAGSYTEGRLYKGRGSARLHQWPNSSSSNRKPSSLVRRTSISECRGTLNLQENCEYSSLPPKVSNIHQLLNDEGSDENPHHSTKDRVTSTLRSNSADRTIRQPPNIPTTLDSSIYNHFPHCHPYFGTSGDFSKNRVTSCIPESHQPHYYVSADFSSTKTGNLQDCGYHQVIFLDTKNHTCEFPGCNMRFKRLEHLKRHFRVHTMEKPFPCTHEGCGKTFSRSDNLSQHIKTHERRAQKRNQYKPTKS
ncbi:hypothetical protein K7432_004807 [Basidiobolus ranarum]|uniref:C2H2-type domain-containing protein n=1 Tax=Basidiobolus ranarum TaxID=34480 RepID=A0ABR2W4H4_9FUNG